MAHEKDWLDFRKAIRLTREIFAQDAFKDLIRHEIQPGVAMQSDDELDYFIKEHVESAYHPCGTCRMGKMDSPMSVVDETGKVIGVQSLRLADSSVFPQITNGNLNAPSIMVGEKVSDQILGKLPLGKSNLEPRLAQDWRRAQR